MSEKTLKKQQVKQIVINETEAGRRIDNYLIRYFEKLPKSRVYQMIRKGEVRVNKGRIKQTYKLVAGDRVRIPPVYQDPIEKPVPNKALQKKIMKSIIYEDSGIIILNKPAGIVVHGGSGQSYGVIEAIRAAGKKYQNLELVHRLDKNTSGCLILAKSIPVLRQLHDTIRSGAIKKTYFALLAGRIPKRKWTVDSPLRKNSLRSGERVVTIDDAGKAALTHFYREQLFKDSTLTRIELVTGRTHQIRVHSASLGHPVIGDIKYGNRDINREFSKRGLKRLFLHASSLNFTSPLNGKKLSINAPLPADLKTIIAFSDQKT